MEAIQNMFKDLFNFLKKVGNLKKIKRQGWITIAGIQNPESVASHSFRCAVLAMCITDLEKLNSEKLIKMLLIHDMHEAQIGDLDHSKKEKIGKNRLSKLEIQAAQKIFSLLPKKLEREYLSLWIEFERKKTPEAKMAKQIDLLEMMIQALEYRIDGYSKERLSKFLKSSHDISDENIKRIYNILIKKFN